MRQEVNLYIGGKELFFSEPPEILFTFQRTDYTNPTIIKNNYTKTITVEGTPENNKVFGELHLLERTQNDVLFNPAKRVDFELYVNGDLTETGYAKLDNIIKNKHKITYELTLYGGLGDFFYGLSYGFDYDDYDSTIEQSKDEELRLKDLTYYSPYADDDTEFNFNITKDAVYDAWRVLGGQTSATGDNKKWDYINFAPAYNGLPDDFDSDKVLINTSGYSNGCRISVPAGARVDGTTYATAQIIEQNTIPQTIVVGDDTYTRNNGYALSELKGEITEWDVLDLRSYLQRPVLRVKGLVEAIQRYVAEKGGYTLNLDSNFFNNNNPYYNKAWITLPMLSNLNGEYAEAEATGMIDFGGYSEVEREVSSIRSTLDGTYYMIGLPSGLAPYKGGSVTFSLIGDSDDYAGEFGDLSMLFTVPDANGGETIHYGTIVEVQLIAYDDNENVVDTSFVHTFCEEDIPLIESTYSLKHYGSFKRMILLWA